MSTIKAVSSDYYGVAGWWNEGSCIVLVRRRSDDHEVWGDQPVPAARPADVPAAATARLRSPVAFRVTGRWTVDPTRSEQERTEIWTADVEVAG